MQSVFGDADAPIVVELARKPDLQGVPEGRAGDSISEPSWRWSP